jgi:hypothetical protein
MSELPEQEAVAQGGSPLDAQDDDDDDDDDKGLTFRKRRLSLTNLRELDQADGENQKSDKNDSPTKQPKDDDANNRTNGLNHHDPKTNSSNGENGDASPFAAAEGDEKAHSFRKRRLSLTHKREDSTDNEDNGSSSIKRMRRNSEASAATNDSGCNNAYNLKSRTSHAAELLAHPPPSPASTSTLPKLYQQAAPPQQLPLLETLGDDSNTAQPKWKKRHTRHKDEKSLPFPRDIVGTFSCHGVEPIYDEDYQYGNVEEDFEEDEDEDDNGWIVGNADLGGKKAVAERPTMAAKINQDRGGVAFPYGNCPKTALFAVYDGT